ncbi:stalk domain-containing protein [Paenibacillus cellulositrophicus]|uniref:stalk domain-containing protein n=1 Tax=Paenibacillus cellulositrophicus TaxID=562959 RepID=UPI00203B5F8D|nr:stalk domain-containing protein [Paenibacillus cellulositrophicus]MCM3001926.1 stalk domain-containing protein [Paenibacillus cellulositrophicus]
MLKKNKMFQVLMASAVVTSVLAGGTAEAASAAKSSSAGQAAKMTSPKLKAAKVELSVNGASVSVNAVQLNQSYLVAVSDIVKAFGASASAAKGIVMIKDATGSRVVQLQAGSKSYKVNGEAAAFTNAPVLQDGKTYVELQSLVEALGGEWIAGSGQTQQVLTVQRPEGSYSSVRWNAQGQIIASRDDAESAQIVKLDPASYGSTVISTDEYAAELAVSPNGQWGAYTDNAGQLYLMNLASGLSQKLGSDTSVKTDLTWSADNSRIYFIQGDKQEKISYMNVGDGKVTEVLADKVENKSDVSLSADGKRLVYIVNVTGVASSDKDSTEESLSIDYSGAGQQLYSLDLTDKEAKPVQLTTSKDNKLYPVALDGGKAAYLSADPDSVTAKDVIKVIGPGSSVQDLSSIIDVTVIAAGPSGTLIAAGIAADGSTKVLKIDSGSQAQLYSTSGTVSELAVSADGSRIALIEDGRILVITGGKTIQLTK